MVDNFLVLKYVKYCKTLYTRLIMKASKEYALTQNECDVLLFLHNNPQFNTAKDVVINRLIAKSNVSTSVESLKQKKYLTVKTDEENRRVVRIFLTEKADPVLVKLRKAQDEFEVILKGDMSEEEIELFFTLVEKNNSNVKNALAELEKED
ncbi:MAG: MarR family transcriptional regulator [Clostridia bacterium]